VTTVLIIRRRGIHWTVQRLLNCCPFCSRGWRGLERR